MISMISRRDIGGRSGLAEKEEEKEENNGVVRWFTLNRFVILDLRSD